MLCLQENQTHTVHMTTIREFGNQYITGDDVFTERE